MESPRAELHARIWPPLPKYRLAWVHASASFLPKVSDALAPSSLPSSSMTPESLHSIPLSFSSILAHPSFSFGSESVQSRRPPRSVNLDSLTSLPPTRVSSSIPTSPSGPFVPGDAPWLHETGRVTTPLSDGRVAAGATSGAGGLSFGMPRTAFAVFVPVGPTRGEGSLPSGP